MSAGKLDTARLYQDSQHAVPDDAALASVSELVERQLRLEDEIAELESTLSAKRAELQRVTTDELPSAMDECGLSELRTASGARVKIESFVQASIPVARRTEAHAWLAANGFADLVKHEIRVTFGKGEDDLAKIAEQALAERGFHPDDRESVHPSTLKAWLREQIEAGAPVPLDLFGAYLGQRTRITRSE